MSVITCKACGRTTNTAVSEWLDVKENFEYPLPKFANGCYAAFENGKWVIGCAYETADKFYKNFVDKLINKEDSNGTT